MNTGDGAVPATDSVTAELCRRVGNLRYEDLPPHIVEAVKLSIIDILGVTGGGAIAPGVGEIIARLTSWEGSGSASILIGKQKVSPPSAALANAVTAHALDFDDQHDMARVHSSCTVFPAILAAAEDTKGVSGQDFILSMAIGIELNARLGLACHDALGLGWHPSTLLGSLSSSLAVGKILGLHPEKLSHALGIAYHQCSGSRQSTIEGAMTKRLGPGLAARAAVLSAYLSTDGMTAPKQSLEGKAGLFALYQRDKVTSQNLLGGLWEIWKISEYSVKPFPCCRCSHTVISLGLLCHKEGIRPESIESVEIGLGEYNWVAVGSRYEPARDDVVHAQFNAAYSFASAVVYGDVGLRTFRRPAITDPEVATLAARATTVVDPLIPKKAVEPARVTLKLRGGERRELYSEFMKGGNHDPLSKEDLLAKFHSCMKDGLGANEEQIECLSDAVFSLEKSADAAKSLIQAFPPKKLPTNSL